MNPHSYAHLIFEKGAKNIWWRKHSLFNKRFWEKLLSICRKLKLHPCLSPCTSINSKWIKDLGIRLKTEVSTGKSTETLKAVSVGKNIINRNWKAQKLGDRIDKCDYIKLKVFYTTK
jgi:hypothetical protein